jgi:hypothetical protein
MTQQMPRYLLTTMRLQAVLYDSDTYDCPISTTSNQEMHSSLFPWLQIIPRVRLIMIDGIDKDLPVMFEIPFVYNHLDLAI